jgi:hypothetical protein
LTKIPAPAVEEVARDHDDNEVKFAEPKGMGAQLNEIVRHFQDVFPDAWEGIARCPTMHGVEIMAHKLAGKG